MKKIVILSLMFYVTLSLTTGCQRAVPDSGTPDHFPVRIADGIDDTRASYDNTQGKFAWDEGDQIAIHFNDGHYETYEVTPNAGDPSVGTVTTTPTGTMSNVRDFYAVYPASSAVATATGDTAPKVSLPSSYDISDVVSGTSGRTTYYSPSPMVAKNVYGQDLDFYHVGGLLRVTVKDPNAATQKMVVTFDKDVTGVYTVNVDNPEEPYITTAGAPTNNVVTFTVASSAAGIGTSVTSVVLNIPVPCGTYNSVKVDFYNASDELLDTRSHAEPPLVFRRHHGKRLAFAEEAVEMVISGDFTDATLDDEGGIGIVSIEFDSYLINGEGDEEPVPFAVEYSETGEVGTWTRTSPSWLTMGAGIDYTGTVRTQRIDIIAAPQENIIPLNPYGIPLDEHTNALRNATPVSDFDLSLKNAATGATVGADNRSTANCYLVQAPGTYSFPVVYGNGLKNGAVNEVAYRGKDENGDWFVDEGVQFDDTRPSVWYMGRFLDHLGNGITTPYIAGQQSGKELTARLLWMDAPGLITNVSYAAGNAADPKDDRITFEVPLDGICQGNAVIAVLADGVIAWSWHIWVTDVDFTVTGHTASGYELAATNLGWVDTRKMEEYEERTCHVRIVQDVPGGAVSDVVTIVQEAAPSVILYGNSPYYNPGRKDPVPGMNGDLRTPIDKPCYPTTAEGNEYYPQFGVMSNTTVSGNIQNPHIQYVGNFDKYYGNLWNSTGVNHKYNNTETFTTKTIYDPSPVGYSVPSYPAYYGYGNGAHPGFSLNNTQWKGVDEMGPGVVPGRTHEDLFFPAMGCRTYTLENVGSWAYYASSSIITITASSVLVPMRLRFTNAQVVPTSGGLKEHMSVRCSIEQQ